MVICLSSCVVAEKLTLSDEITKTQYIKGKNHVDLSVDDFFVGVVEDLSDWSGSGNDDPIIDVAVNDFVTNLNRSTVTSSVKFVNTGHNTYMGDFSFSDFNKLLKDLSNGNENQSIVRAFESNGKTRVEIMINMDNYSELTQIVPFLANPNFEVYGPLYNNELTEADYLDMVSFILGEECPSSIASSSIKIQLVAPKNVSSHNGTLKNARTVEFSFPLIQFLLLHEPIYFWLEY